MRELYDEDKLFNLWIALVQAQRCIWRAREKELLQYKTTPEKTVILYILDKLGGQATRPDICRYSCREVQTIYRIINRMAKEDLVQLRKRNKGPKQIQITEKGRKVFQNASKRESIHQILSFLSDEELSLSISLLEKIMKRSLKVLEKDQSISSLK